MKSHDKLLNETVVLVLLLGSVCIVNLNLYMFNVAIPFIMEDFHILASSTSLVTTMYAVILAVGSSIYGKLADRFSIRSLFLIGLLVFGAGSILGLFSNSLIFLVIARVLQACGSAAIAGLSYVVPSKYFKQETKGRALSVVAMTFVLAGGVAPVISGYFVQWFGWHSLFVVSLLTVFTIPFVVKFLPNTVQEHHTFDVLGAGLFSTAVASIILGISVTPYLLILSLILFVLLVLQMRRKSDPFIPLSLFRQNKYRNSLLSQLAVTSSFAAIIFTIPILLRQSGFHAVEIGFILFPGTVIGSLLGRGLDKLSLKYGVKNVMFSSHLLMILCSLFIALIGRNPILIAVGILPLALSYTTLVASNAKAANSALKPAQAGIGMGLITLFGILGSAFGPSIISRILTLHIGFGIVFVTTMVISCIGLVFGLFVSEKKSGVQDLVQDLSLQNQ